MQTEDLNIISNGNPIKIINMKNGDYNLAWTHYKNIPLAIGKIKNSVFYPFRVLNLYKISSIDKIINAGCYF